MSEDSDDRVFAISRVKDPQLLEGRGGLFSTQRGIAFFKRLLSRNHLSEERGREARIESDEQHYHRSKELWINKTELTAPPASRRVFQETEPIEKLPIEVPEPIANRTHSPKERGPEAQAQFKSQKQFHHRSKPIRINRTAPSAPPAPRRIFRETKSIEILPIEVLEVIASFLPTSSAVLFILSSRIVMLKLGTEAFKAINKQIGTSPQVVAPYSPPYAKEQQHLMSFWREDQKDFQSFLQLYDRERPNSIYCRYCRKIHNPSRSHAGSRHLCASVTFALWNHPYFPYDIYFNKLQYIMKRHRLGLETAAQLSELSDIKITRSLEDRKYTRQISTLARIRNNKLFLRTQDWTVIPSNPKLQLPSWWNFQHCPHWGIYQHTAWQRVSFNEIEQLICCKLSHYNQPRCSRCSDVIRCKECPTEFQLDSRKIGKDQWALVFTVWKDFGRCENPFDPNCNWDRHRRKGNGQGLGQRANYKGKSIKNVFERYEVGNGLSLENFQAMELK